MKAKLSTPVRTTSLPKSAQMLKASLAPKPAPAPSVTQTILSANLSNGNLGIVRAAIKDGAKPAQVKSMVAGMQSQAKHTGVAASVAAAQRAQASKLNRLG